MSNTSILAQIEAAITRGKGAQELLEMILGHFGAQSGTIHYFDAPSQQLKLVAQIGVPEVILDKVRDIPIGKGIAGLAALERRPVTVCNIQTDNSGRVAPNAKLTGMEGAIAVPMLVEGGLYGTLGVGKSTEYTWSDAETREIEQIAARLPQVVKGPTTG